MAEKETVTNREGNCNFLSPEKDKRIEKDWRRKVCYPQKFLGVPLKKAGRKPAIFP